MFNPIEITVTEPDTIHQIASFIENKIPTRQENETIVKRNFEALIKDFVDERFPKDIRFPGKQQSVEINAQASNGIATIRVAAQYDPYNLDHYLAVEYIIKTDGNGNPITQEKKAIFSNYQNVIIFLKYGPAENSDLQVGENFEPLITLFQD